MSRRGEVRDLSTSRRQRPRRNQGWDVGRRQQMEEPKKNRRKIPRDKRIEGKCMRAHEHIYTWTQTNGHTHREFKEEPDIRTGVNCLQGK